MRKQIVVDGREVAFEANALTPRLYRHKYGRDIIRDLNALKTAYSKAAAAHAKDKPGADASPEEVARYQEELQAAQLSALDLEIFEDVAYIMAKQADPATADNPEAWLEDFSVFSIYEVLPEILELWALNQVTTSKPKKK